MYNVTCVMVTWIKQSPLYNSYGHKVPNISVFIVIFIKQSSI